MADRWNREVDALGEALEAWQPGHPWIPLIVAAVRSQYEYRMLGRHGHKMYWDVAIPNMTTLKKVGKRIDLSLFTEEAALDENSAVHKILMLCVGRMVTKSGGTIFRSVLRGADHAHVEFPADFSSSKIKNYGLDYVIDGIECINNSHTLLGNVDVRIFNLNGLLSRMHLISQLKL